MSKEGADGKVLQFRDPKQPAMCLYYEGATCGYPIGDCAHCPLHEIYKEDGNQT